MCGIIGIAEPSPNRVNKAVLQEMTDVLRYRGPDGEGLYIKGRVGLGHRRLSVIDLSDAGRQPMADTKGQRVISYNGEVYNFRELRKQLERKGYRFRSQTDTEVILQSYAEWGEACVSKFNGMFAFAILDWPKRRLFLARDRFGIKPLYWTYQRGRFLFASEIKAILKHPAIRAKVSLPALDEYFTFQNLLTERTLFEGICLLPAGSTLTYDLKAEAPPTVERYWNFQSKPDSTLTEGDCEARLYDLFCKAVERQLVSDVPIGAYLSGGMDSGSIVAVARQNLGRLKTFTGGFDLSSASGLELGFDERANSEFLANLLKTEHYEMVMHAGDMEHIMPMLIRHLEDLRVGQCYPNFYIAQLAGKFVKVVLSGAGGDELFAGYPWRYYRGATSRGKEDFLKRYYGFWQRLVPDEEKRHLFHARARPSADHPTAMQIFSSVFDGWQGSFDQADDFIDASLYFELKTFLHGLLVVEDKLSMAHSMETRVPFLDNELVDFAMTIPVRYKLKPQESATRVDENLIGKRLIAEQQHHNGKVILRRAMSRLIPPSVTERAKQGFSAPDSSWFRGESIEYVKKLLDPKKARLYDFINPAYVQRRLGDHVAGKRNDRLFIWSLISFEWWLRTFIN